MAGRRRHRDPDDPARHSGRAHRDHRRAAARRRQPLLEDRTIRSRRRCSSSSTASARRRWTIRFAAVAGDRRASTAPRDSSGRRRPRIATRCGRRATTRLRRRGVAAGRAGVDDGCLCADLAPGGMHPRDASRIWPPHVVAPLVGHAGDGNFHLIFMVDPDDPTEFAAVQAAQRAAGRARAEVRRHLHRRARRRLRQAEIPVAGARRGARRDALDQACARSGEPDESRVN